METNHPESKMLGEVRRWRREAHAEWSRLSLVERRAETARMSNSMGLRVLDETGLVKPVWRNESGESNSARSAGSANGNGVSAEKVYSVEQVREVHPRAYESWSPEEEESLKRLFKTGMEMTLIAERLQRQPGAIRSRLVKLGLVA